ncbi:MAG: 2-hydroxyacid dehydrogenase [Alphaproteobacteria bacterium]|nr:2-hydroxyacid dehydrogenase [Alphaproteobacteria bacterium]
MASSLPLVLIHPPLPGFEGQMSALYSVRHIADMGDDADAITAAVVIGSVGLPADALPRLTGLKLVHCLGAGYDGVDVPAMRARGVTVTNCPAVNAIDVADTAMGLLLSVTRMIAAGDRLVRAGQWVPPLAFPPVRRVSGRKLGIVGFGAIGSAIATRAAGFGLDIRWTGPRPKADAPYPFEPSLLALAEWADILAIAVRADASTEKLIDARVLEALGSEGVVINISRGSVIDEDALIAALKARQLGGAGLDVFEEEPTPPARWADVPNVTLTPHLGGGVREALIEFNRITFDNLRRHFAGEPPATPVP